MGEIDNLFSEGGSDEGHLKILSELTNEDKIRVFSEMSDNEIKAFTKLEYLSKLLKEKYRRNIFNLEYLLNTFLALRVNLDRKSRGEFVNAFSSERTSRIENKTLNQMQGLLR
jgi:hypothetical protein